jgi:hypothetical protein
MMVSALGVEQIRLSSSERHRSPLVNPPTRCDYVGAMDDGAEPPSDSKTQYDIWRSVGNMANFVVLLGYLLAFASLAAAIGLASEGAADSTAVTWAAVVLAITGVALGLFIAVCCRYIGVRALESMIANN